MENYDKIARYTTPEISFTPEAVSISDIAEIRLVISQYGTTIIKSQLDAVILDDAFHWHLTQQDTKRLKAGVEAYASIDYVTNGGRRFTVLPTEFMVVESAVNEVI